VSAEPDAAGAEPAVEGSPTSAAALSEDAIVRHRGDRPQTGWRHAVLQATGGVVNPGVGAREAQRQQWRARIRRPLRGVHRIAVVSVKGGVGKTTVAAGLGLALADNRGDRVVVQDADPDAGTLADRLGVAPPGSARSLLGDPHRMSALSDVDRHLGLAGRLHVLAGDQDPRIARALERADHERLSTVLGAFHDIVLTDCGTGLVHPLVRAALDLADTLVVAGAPTVDGASRASATLDWLDAHDRRALTADAIVVLTEERTSDEVDRDGIRAHFAARARAVVELPHDPHLAAGAVLDPDRLRPATQDAFLLLAALVADRFGTGPAVHG
jgi:MinD-like ATPase involved in chromosome partitioning or flagellar assembly